MLLTKILFGFLVTLNNQKLAEGDDTTLLRFGGGIPVSNSELETGKFSAWSVGTYSSTTTFCVGVLIGKLKFILAKQCTGQPLYQLVSLGSTAPHVNAAASSPGVTELYDIIQSVQGYYRVVTLFPAPNQPDIAVPALVMPSGSTPPPTGQICQVFGFSDGSIAGKTKMNRIEISVMDVEQCKIAWAAQIIQVDTTSQFCLKMETAEGRQPVCMFDKYAPAFCKSWKSETRIFWISKDDDDEDEEAEETWVFTGFLQHSAAQLDGCSNPGGLPYIYDFYTSD